MSSYGDITEILVALGHDGPKMRRPIARDGVDVGPSRPEPQARGRRSRPTATATHMRQDFTGAGMCGSVLAIATLKRSRSGALTFDHHLSDTFELRGPEQTSTEAFYHQLQFFFYEKALKRLFLRGAIEKGQYVSSRQGKIEGVVQLVEGLTVNLVQAPRVPAWISRENPTLPECTWVFNSNERAAMKLAIQVAAYAESGGTGLSSGDVLRNLLDV